MEVIFTDQSLKSLTEILDFIRDSVSEEKVDEIKNKIINKTDILLTNPHAGQKELNLEHLGTGHRRLIERNYKIVYRIEGNIIYITDIFDSRQNPEKMKP
jgi:plasmid stabilization system protein ParE